MPTLKELNAWAKEAENAAWRIQRHADNIAQIEKLRDAGLPISRYIQDLGYNSYKEDVVADLDAVQQELREFIYNAVLARQQAKLALLEAKRVAANARLRAFISADESEAGDA